MKARTILQQKRYLNHHDGVRSAVFEVVIWQVPKSAAFPEGIKYRIWLSEGGRTLVGFDNHRPKGHHLHLGDVELPYLFRGIDELRRDVGELIRREGFIYEG